MIWRLIAMNFHNILTYEEFYTEIINLEKEFNKKTKPFFDLNIKDSIFGFSFLYDQLTLHVDEQLEPTKNSIIKIEIRDVNFPKHGSISNSLVSIDASIVNDMDYLINIYYYVYEKFVNGEEMNSIIIKLSNFLHNYDKDSTFLQGLVGELLFILSQTNKIELINAWHSDSTNTYDFYNSTCKFEVKSTSKAFRVHTLSSDQIIKSDDVFLCSVLLNVSEDFFTISDLVDRIVSEGSTPSSSVDILKKKVISSISNKSISMDTKIFYDINYSLNNILCFEIPKNDIYSTYNYIKNYSIDIDFTNMQNLPIINMNSTNNSEFSSRTNRKNIPGFGFVIQQ